MAQKPLTVDRDARLLARIAWAYHVEELTQEAVAEKLGLTRLRVNRALAEARRCGLVRVTLDTAYAPCFELEAALRARYGLETAFVAPRPTLVDDVQTSISAGLGSHLSDLLARPEILQFGMSWGGTLHGATRFVAPLERPDLEIISVMGGLTEGSEISSFEITTTLASICKARHSYFTAPLYAESMESRDTIMGLDVFRRLLDRIRRVDALAMAAGDLSRRSILMRDGLPADMSVEALIEAGGVGDMLGWILDAEGRPIDHPINERVIGIGIDDLRGVPDVILAAGGAHKVPIIRAALSTGVIDTLVTDEDTGKALLVAR